MNGGLYCRIGTPGDELNLMDEFQLEGSLKNYSDSCRFQCIDMHITGKYIKKRSLQSKTACGISDFYRLLLLWITCLGKNSVPTNWICFFSELARSLMCQNTQKQYFFQSLRHICLYFWYLISFCWQIMAFDGLVVTMDILWFGM